MIKDNLNNESKIEYRDTGKYGLGVYASKNIKEGEFVWRMTGEKVSLAECWTRINSGNEDLTDPLQVGLEEYLDLNKFSRLFNHSCEPNLGIKNESDLFALKNIKKGDELTFDYSTTVGPNIPISEWFMDCGCGSEKCRKIISNILSIPKIEIEKYLKKGFLQDYIKDYLKNNI